MDVDINLATWFAARAERSPARAALTFENTTLTFAQMARHIDHVAAGLSDRGIVRGDRIAFLGANQTAFLLTLLASARIGAIFVPLNTRLTSAELSFIVSDAAPAALIVDSDHRSVADAMASENAPSIRALVGPPHSEWLDFDDLGSVGAEFSSRGTTDADDAAIIMYTSGTTGRPKGAVLSHANLWWNNINLLGQFDVLEDDVTLVVAPLFHIAGLNVTTFTTWMRGGHVVLHRRFDASAVLDAVAEHRITTMFGVPAMLAAMSRHEDFSDADLRSLRMVICGGAPVPEPLLREYADRGIGVMQGYGLTESSPSATFLGAQDALAKIGSAGKPPLYTAVRLVRAEDGQPATQGERGEILLKGPNVTRGYWNRPDATAQTIDSDGWFHTGDVGYLDDEGFMYVVDRIKDMIITGGENVYPAEVESVLSGHPDVVEVAVIGTPHPKWGETVTAVVVPRPGVRLDLETLRRFAGASLARYKLPTVLIESNELPRNASGKLLKNILRDGTHSADQET